MNIVLKFSDIYYNQPMEILQNIKLNMTIIMTIINI